MKKKNISFKSVMAQPISQILLFVVVLVVLQLLSMVGVISAAFVYALGSTLIYAILAIGFCLLLGYSGLVSLGTAGFIGIGAYVGYFIMQEYELPYIVAFVATVAIALLIGLAVGFISLRIEGMYLALLTLGLSEIIRNLVMVIKSTIKIDLSKAKVLGIQLGDRGAYFLVLITFAVLLWLTFNLVNSPTGRAMLAMKNSTAAAQAMGISLLKFRLLAFAISIVYASIGGLLYMMYVRAMTTSTSTLLTITTSLNILGAVIIGGYKSLWGTTFGVFLIYGLQTMFLSKIQFFQDHPAFVTMVTGLLIIVVVMFFPGGIAQLVNQLKAWIAKKTAKKTAKPGKEAA